MLEKQSANFRHGSGKIFISIDRGGTFTDVYGRCGDRVYTEKLLSRDPANYADASGEGIRRVLERITGVPVRPGAIPVDRLGWIRMGTTVATNALLERTGAPLVLVITRLRRPAHDRLPEPARSLCPQHCPARADLLPGYRS